MAATQLPSPATLETCDGKLPRDTTPHVLRFSQLLLFSDGKSDQRGTGGPRVCLILPHHQLAASAPPKSLPWLRTAATDLVAQLRVTADRASGQLPDADGPLPKLRTAARDHAISGITPNLAEARVRTLYGSWLRTAQGRESALWTKLCAVAGLPELPLPTSLAAAESALHDAIFPRPFAPLPAPHAHVALCAVYEQQWTPLGYTRGDLVGSISLAPGEQVTLEVHSWDKTTFKSEDELNIDSELRVSTKTTQRDTAQVVDEMSTESGSKLTRQFKLGLPTDNKEIPITGSASIDADTTQEIKDSLKSTVDRTSERTEEAASTLKNQRKTRIEISRDTGREQKQTRVVVNTNRARTLNCYYFEIVANYRAETRLVELRPCLLLPYPRQPLTRRWILSHEFVLRQALLDASFLPGFEAAKTLELADVLATLQVTPPTAGNSEAACASARNAILSASTALEDAVHQALAALTALSSNLARIGGPRAYRLMVLHHLHGDTLPLRRLLYAAALRADGKTLNALAQLRASDGTPARAALEAFFGAVSAADFSPAMSTTRVAEGLHLHGLVASLVDRLVFGGLLSETPDDAGLAAAVSAAAACLAASAPAATTASSRPTTRAATATLSSVEAANTSYPTVAATSKEKVPLLRVAEATVEYTRLCDHLREYAPHYQQAVWLRTHPDERARWLRAQEFAVPIVSDEILGFEHDKAVHPIADLAAVRKVLDFDTLLKNVRASAIAPQTTLLSLPTPGTVLESMLGQCDAVEDYIQQSRAIELRQKSALAAQDEAEVERRRQRLSATPPELGEFVTPVSPCGCNGSSDYEAAPEAEGK